MISYPEVKVSYSKGVYTFNGNTERICKFFNDGETKTPRKDNRSY